MSMFLESNRFANEYTIEAAEGYNGSVGVSRMMIESATNDLRLFTGLIGADFKEIALGESATVEELAAINEATGSGFLARIKEFIQRIIAKIKGLFASFIARLNSLIIRDNKKFVEKYKDAVLKKTYGEDFKYKFRELKGSDLATQTTKLTTDAESKLSTETFQAIFNKSQADIEKELDELSSGTAMADQAYGKKTAEEFKKDLVDSVFKDEEEKEKLSTQELMSVMNYLLDSKKTVEAAEKAQAKIVKYFSDRLRDIDSVTSKVNAAVVPSSTEAKEVDMSKIGGNEAQKLKGAGARASKALNLMYKRTQIEEMTFTTTTAVVIECIKFHVKQCRSLFAKAAAYNPKRVNESTFLDAIGESAEHEVEMELEGIYAY